MRAVAHDRSGAKVFRPRAQVISDYVRAGGVLVCMVGAEEAWASASLLRQFGLEVPRSPVPTTDSRPEPEPMGHLRSLFLERKAMVREITAAA